MAGEAPTQSGPFGDIAWDALVSDPAVGVAVVAVDGTIRFANRKTAQLFLAAEPEDVVGKKLGDLFPADWSEERLQILRRIADTGQPVVLRSIRRGTQIQSAMRLLECDHGDKCILVITHEGEHDIPDRDGEFEIIESKTADLGPLDVLTRRELEVLALIKHGMTLDQIAKILHRSRKTIDNHRQSIARKLGESSRVRLAQIAESAGLEVSDAALKRTRTRRN
ncbi:MAG: LuxR C-terminal-related transcriptional regulator [Phycisphaerales bacterium]